jgi:hypothetical protein
MDCCFVCRWQPRWNEKGDALIIRFDDSTDCTMLKQRNNVKCPD